MTMTSAPPARLRAVPPSASPNPDQSKPTPPAPTPQDTAHPNRGSGRRWLIAVGGLVGLGCLSLIPIPHRVTGAGAVTAADQAFETVFMPAAGGTITDILVTTNHPVTAHTAIALLEMTHLENQLIQTEQQQAQGLAQLERYRQQIPLRQGEVTEAAARIATTQREVDRLHNELNGGPPPAVQGWQGEIAALQAEITGLQGDLQNLTNRTERAQIAVEQGAISQIEMEGWQAQQTQLQNQIVAKQGQITAKQAQIDGFYQDKQADLTLAQGRLTEQQAHGQSTQQAAQAAVAEATAQEQVVLLEADDVTRQQAQLADLQVLRTTITGTVITPQPDIDALRGRYVEPGQPILEVANPGQFTVEAWVRQEDRDLLREGMVAEFRPQSGEWESYPAVVATVSPRTEFNETEQKPMVRVTLRLEQADPHLQLNATGTARIQTGTLPIHAKVRREFLKVVPLQKLWAF